MFFLKILKGIFHGCWFALTFGYLFIEIIAPVLAVVFSVQVSTLYYMILFTAGLGFIMGFTVPFWKPEPQRQSSREAFIEDLTHQRPFFANTRPYYVQPISMQDNILPFPNSRVYVPHYSNVEAEPINIVSENAIEKRLTKIGYNTDQLPEKFIDPISCTVMSKPILAFTTIINSEGKESMTPHVYDEVTFKKLNGICPENRQYFTEFKEHLELKSEIESFVKEQEKLVAPKTQESISIPKNHMPRV